MAKFRKIHTSFWDDPYIEKLSAEDRYFFLFLLTNPLCTECGIYTISFKKMIYWSGYNEETVKAIIKRFFESKKVIYNLETEEMCLLNKPNFIDHLGKPQIDCLISEFKKVKDKTLIQKQLEVIERDDIRNVYVTCTSRGEEEEVKKKKEEKEEEGYRQQLNTDKPFFKEQCQIWELTNEALKAMISEFHSYNLSKEKYHSNFNDFKSHFVSWGKKKYTDYKKKKSSNYEFI